MNGDIIADAPERYRLVWQDAGISYDKTDAVPKKNEQQITGIKDEVITKELLFAMRYASSHEIRPDLYSA